LRIDPKEKVTLITDRATEPIAAALGAQLAARGCEWNVFLLEDLAPRPLSICRRRCSSRYGDSQVSIFAVQVQRMSCTRGCR
jgi:aminopeptidase